MAKNFSRITCNVLHKHANHQQETARSVHFLPSACAPPSGFCRKARCPACRPQRTACKRQTSRRPVLPSKRARFEYANRYTVNYCEPRALSKGQKPMRYPQLRMHCFEPFKRLHLDFCLVVLQAAQLGSLQEVRQHQQGKQRQVFLTFEGFWGTCGLPMPAVQMKSDK